MRLLLDEHIDKAVAKALQEQGFDVVAVTEDPTLRASSDDALLLRALEDRRAILTYDVDFRAAALERLSMEEHHYGIVLLTPRRFPQRKDSFGALIAALRRLLGEMPADDALVDRERWLV